MRRGLVIGGIAVVVLAVGQLLIPGTPPAPAPPAPAAAVAPPAPAAAPADVARSAMGATTVVAGIPMGYSHDPAGAKAAAAGYTEAYGTLVAVDHAAAVAAKRAMASTATADQLVAAMEARLGPLRQTWPVGAITYRVAPLAVRVAMDGPDTASAEVWYVGLIGGRGLPTYEEWVTQSLTLVWERDDWRISAESDSPGPRPDPGRQSPASAAELEARLVGFEDVA